MAILFLSFIGCCLAWVVYARRFHSLAKYPGPFLASITRLWLVIDVARGNSDETQRRLHRIYGPIVRIAPDEVAIADPEAIRTIYAAHSGFTKTDFYLPFRATWGRYPDAFTNLNERQHAERRKIISSSYSMTSIEKLEDKIDRCTQVLVKKFGECAENDASVDLSEWVQWYTFDVVGELFFSHMLQHFFNVMHDQGTKKDFGMTEVKMEIYGAFIAGSDTTAAAISAILYHLMRTPSAYAKLTEEIDAARKETRLSENVQYREAKRLPYLVACCKEAMRLHPSVGQWFPGGTRVGVNAAVVQRDRQVFGDDADGYIPERWLGADVARMERYMFQFGGGARACIGKNISLCEIYKVVPQLLSVFHLELKEPEKEWKTHTYWFHKPGKVFTTVRCR
ncbi:hypothetical protein E8E11_001884 [Didymella keratinophila]|nr:hypothetical protein E8E11_001884 [Didymella keratinophila]